MECWLLLVYAIGGFLSFVGVAAYCGIAKVSEYDVDVAVAFPIAALWPIFLIIAILVGLFSGVKRAAAKIGSHREQLTTTAQGH